MLEIAAAVIGMLLLAVALPVMFVTWVRAAVNLFRVANHVKEQDLTRHPSLRWNRFNAIFFPGALDDKGKKARTALFKNLLVFVAIAVVVMGYATWTGLVTT